MDIKSSVLYVNGIKRMWDEGNKKLRDIVLSNISCFSCEIESEYYNKLTFYGNAKVLYFDFKVLGKLKYSYGNDKIEFYEYGDNEIEIYFENDSTKVKFCNIEDYNIFLILVTYVNDLAVNGSNRLVDKFDDFIVRNNEMVIKMYNKIYTDDYKLDLQNVVVSFYNEDTDVLEDEYKGNAVLSWNKKGNPFNRIKTKAFNFNNCIIINVNGKISLLSSIEEKIVKIKNNKVYFEKGQMVITLSDPIEAQEVALWLYTLSSRNKKI